MPLSILTQKCFRLRASGPEKRKVSLIGGKSPLRRRRRRVMVRLEVPTPLFLRPEKSHQLQRPEYEGAFPTKGGREEGEENQPA